MTAPAPARSLAILGSCVGRDSATVLQERGWRVTRYIARQSIISTGTAVDISAIDAGARVYSTSRFGFVQRRGDAAEHTWAIDDAEILATSRISHWGPPGAGEMP